MFGPAMRRFGHGTDLLSEMQYLHNEMSRLFSSVAPQTVHEYPPINVWSGEDNAIVTAEMPGIDPSVLDISVIGDTLTISGKIEPEEIKGGVYHRQERNYGYFKRILQLPFHVNAEKVEARYENGILQVKLPRSEDDKPRKVMIQAE
ncbi:MAG: Hsp20/alpha crystallin family protein [Syntrophobacterales bacterium]|jgi:HSP20 family protein|nr:Hsp20/alpha crystallin family protein [Syntrophobacterales bacterium]